jgi:membrane-associated protease RseP (regulator of RpoE activity)
VEQLRRMIREIPSGRIVSVGISREGQPMAVKAQLAERKKMPNMDQSFNFAMPPVNIPAIHVPQINMPEMDLPMTVVVIHSLARSGLMVENLTPQLGDYFGVKSGNGVMVRSVEKGSRAEQAGFHAGDVIVRVNGTAVNDCSDFTRLLRARKENKAAITVMRERKEQNLTLTLPEPKRTGSLEEKECESESPQACAEILKEEISEVIPEITTAEIKRIQPEIEKTRTEIQEEILNHSDELKTEMEELQQDLRQQQDDLQQEMKRWTKDADI